jgi:uncharacterized protein (UPF0297 family)
MPRTKKTAVSRETKSASPPAENAGTKLKSNPQTGEFVNLPLGDRASGDAPILWQDFYMLVNEILAEKHVRDLIDDIYNRLDSMGQNVEKINEQIGGYSLKQWEEDYKRWRDTIIGFALDDAIAGLKSET